MSKQEGVSGLGTVFLAAAIFQYMQPFGSSLNYKINRNCSLGNNFLDIAKLSNR
jgi:hypothetical protein